MFYSLCGFYLHAYFQSYIQLLKGKSVVAIAIKRKDSVTKTNV